MTTKLMTEEHVGVLRTNISSIYFRFDKKIDDTK